MKAQTLFQENGVFDDGERESYDDKTSKTSDQVADFNGPGVDNATYVQQEAKPTNGINGNDDSYVIPIFFWLMEYKLPV